MDVFSDNDDPTFLYNKKKIGINLKEKEARNNHKQTENNQNVILEH